jgi:hypothetical protein
LLPKTGKRDLYNKKNNEKDYHPYNGNEQHDDAHGSSSEQILQPNGEW